MHVKGMSIGFVLLWLIISLSNTALWDINRDGLHSSHFIYGTHLTNHSIFLHETWYMHRACDELLTLAIHHFDKKNK